MKGNIDIGEVFKPGDPPPSSYLQWHDWAKVQAKAGLRQERCGYCSLFRFPQEMSGKTVTATGETKRGRKVIVTLSICKHCAALHARAAEQQ